ncbi:hypothetical protein TrLO_g1424 [Triparma laevis f. longispina]|uniref:Uncharacterized protein n=1 Tax=Triparma laevis f. longispina TaxID=1714387 RepID=A0A9W7FPZ2_9STRA|nr:hypothetical protein TrLO_g1424 [Triparma laevis f. longispina]
MSAIKNNKNVAVGIHVGPSYTRLSTAAFVLSTTGNAFNVTPSVVSNALGSRSTPSIVTVDANTEGAVVIGEAAKKNVMRESSNADNKGEVVKTNSYLKKLSNGDNADSLHFFGMLKELAAETSGVGMKGADRLKCVLAVPAGAGQAEVDRLVEAAGAGFNKPTSFIGVLSEPAAVCVAHGLTGSHTNSHTPSWSTAIVIDWTATGLTATLVKRVGSSDLIQLGASKTDNEVNAESLVDLMMGHCATMFKRKTGGDVWESKKAIAKLRIVCETAVRTLDRGASATVEADGLVDGMDLRVPVSKPRWEMLSGSVVAKGKEFISSLAEGVKVDVCLMSGSVCAMPSVKAMVTGLFEGAWQGLGNVACEEAVAVGCAVQACLMVEAGIEESRAGLKGQNIDVEVAEEVKIGLAKVEGDKVDENSIKVIVGDGTAVGVEVAGFLAGLNKGDAAAVVDMNDGNKILVKIDDCDEGELKVGIRLGKEGGVVVRVGEGEIAC